MKTEKFYSVSQINQYIKELFDNIPFFCNITIKGEVTNFHGRNKSGHLYFSLKDEKSSISVALFKYDSLKLRFEPKNGDLVYATGMISSYPPSGTYQLICRNLTLVGEGELLLKKEELKKKLFDEGIFDESHKKELPEYPEKIAIITGKNSAAAKDFQFNIKRRYPIVEIGLFYSLVQGVDAPKDLIRALNEAIEYKPDLIIIGRGGGANDDLNAFDDENLVREIYKCEIPVLSAIGHEINLSLCDLVADKHASTPTGAAELAVPDINDVKNDINRLASYLDSLIKQKITTKENQLLSLSNKKCFSDISTVIEIHQEKINTYSKRIDYIIENRLSRYENVLANISKHLDLVNPNSLLDKGYSILFDDKGNHIKSIKNIKASDKISVKMLGGEIRAQVEEVKNDE